MASSSSNLLIFFALLIFSSFHFSSSQQQRQPTEISSFSFSTSPWTPTQNQILVSPNSTFAAGFLPLSSSSPPNLYTFSVWYYNISTTVVWSTNYSSPLGSSASLQIVQGSGELRLVNGSRGQNLWPASPRANSTQLLLRESGELVYGEWSSFVYPTNTILPNQNISGTTLASRNGKFEFVEAKRLFFNGTENYYEIGNALQMFDDLGRVTQEGQGVSFISSDYGDRSLRRLTLDEDGNLRLYSFDSDQGKWITVWQAIYELCRIHGTCGPNAICMYDISNISTSCMCPPGFRKVSEEACERDSPALPDMKNSKFLRLDYVNFTGGSNQTDIKALNFSICESECLKKPNCLGFMYKYDGSGYCVLQLDRLLYGYWSPGTETSMFLRVDKSVKNEPVFTGMTNVMETTCPVRIGLPRPPEELKTTTRNIAIISTLFAAELISGVFFFWAFLKKYIKYRDMARTFGFEFMPTGGPKRFSHAELKEATNNFSNIIGKGGFGDVYMGKLSDGRVVAVKCLKNVAGGDADFWAEVTIIARMHHLNLVRLWGFCAEKGSRILVYEYVPNGSLDKFLFQKEVHVPEDSSAEHSELRKPILDWNIRYRIALGVARAIAYLHEECLEWVLHCDIKPENILLGDDFCPKVSDFGLAKLKKKEDIMSMSRIRGTPGYVAPEWTRSEQITSKADVYSFGLVLLEIVSGVRNFEQQSSEVESDQWYFPRWAFDKVFKEMNVEDILDYRIRQSYDSRAHFDMINRMVKTAMWCLQDRQEMRPSMGKVAKMLEGTVEITEPKKPTIFFLSDD